MPWVSSLLKSGHFHPISIYEAISPACWSVSPVLNRRLAPKLPQTQSQDAADFSRCRNSWRVAKLAKQNFTSTILDTFATNIRALYFLGPASSIHILSTQVKNNKSAGSSQHKKLLLASKVPQRTALTLQESHQQRPHSWRPSPEGSQLESKWKCQSIQWRIHQLTFDFPRFSSPQPLQPSENLQGSEVPFPALSKGIRCSQMKRMVGKGRQASCCTSKAPLMWQRASLISGKYRKLRYTKRSTLKALAAPWTTRFSALRGTWIYAIRILWMIGMGGCMTGITSVHFLKPT